jgi:hypothetical protein
MVHDGEVPPLSRGDQLADHGLCASGWLLDELVEPDGFVLKEGLDPGGAATVHYKLSGTVEWLRPETDEAIVIVDGVKLLTRLSDNWHARVRVGSRMSALCELTVVGDYEWLAFGLPNIRQDWTVGAMKLERRAIDWRDVRGEGRRRRHYTQGTPGQVLAVEEIDRLRPGVDDVSDQMMTRYLLDLSPA